MDKKGFLSLLLAFIMIIGSVNPVLAAGLTDSNPKGPEVEMSKAGDDIISRQNGKMKIQLPDIPEEALGVRDIAPRMSVFRSVPVNPGFGKVNVKVQFDAKGLGQDAFNFEEVFGQDGMDVTLVGNDNSELGYREAVKSLELIDFGVQDQSKIVPNKTSGAPATIELADAPVAAKVLVSVDGGTLERPNFTFTYTVFLYQLATPKVKVETVGAEGTTITNPNGTYSATLGTVKEENIAFTAEEKGLFEDVVRDHRSRESLALRKGDLQLAVTGEDGNFVTIDQKSYKIEKVIDVRGTSTIKLTEQKDFAPQGPGENKPDVPNSYVKVEYKVDTNKATINEGQTVIYWVNPEAEVNLPAPEITVKTGFNYTGWDVTMPSTFTQAKDINATFEDITDVVPGNQTKPDGYVTVNFKEGTDGKFDPSVKPEEKTVFVNPNKKVKLQAPLMKANDGYTHSGWDKNLEDTFTVDPTDITATYSFDENVVPQKSGEDKPTVPDNFVKVEFKAEETKGTVSGTAIYWVNPDVQVEVSAGQVTAKTGFEHNGWDHPGYNKEENKVVATFAKSTDINATFDTLEDVIPGQGNTKPDGYVEVKFTAGTGVNLTGEKIFYVNPEQNKKMSEITLPTVTLQENYKDAKWTPKINGEEVITAKKEFISNAVSSIFDKNNITEIRFTKDPAKMTYKQGQDDVLALAGLNIVLKDVNGNEQPVTATTLDEFGVTVTPTDGTELTTENNGKNLVASVSAKTEEGQVTELTANSPSKLTVENPLSEKIVIPYVPTNPENPTDPSDTKIPTVDEDGNNIDDKQYVIVGFVAKDNGTLTLGEITGEKAISLLVKNGTDWSAVTKPTPVGNEGYAFLKWDKEPTGLVTNGAILRASFVTTGDVIDKDDTLPEGWAKVTIDRDQKSIQADDKYGKTYAVEYGKKLAEDKFPIPVANASYKDPKWYKDGTEVTPSTFVIKEEAITFLAKAMSENIIEDLTPDTNDDRPGDNYVKVKFNPTIDGTLNDNNKFDLGRTKAYWVLKDTAWSEVAVPTAKYKDRTKAFDKWTPDFPETVTEDVEFTANYSDEPNVIPGGEGVERPEGYYAITFETGNHGTFTPESKTEFYIKGGITWGTAKAEQALVIPTVIPNTGYEVHQSPWSPNFGDEHTITRDHNITALYQEVDDFVEADQENPESNKPEGYVTVSFAIKAEDNDKGKFAEGSKLSFHVNPEKEVILPAPRVIAQGDFIHVGWDSDPLVAVKYGKDTTINAIFEESKDIVPGTETKPSEDFVTITFNPGDNGQFAEGVEEGQKSLHVRKDKTIILPAPEVKANTGFKFTGWNPDVTKAQKYSEDTEIIAQYEAYDDVVSGSEAKPEGYVTVEFTVDMNKGTLEGESKFYVNPETIKTIGDANITEPTITAKTGFKVADQKWTPNFQDDTAITKGTDLEYTANLDELDGIISGDQDKPEGYVTIRFTAGDHGNFADDVTDAETIFYINPEKEVVLTEQGNALEAKIKADTGWKFSTWDTNLAESRYYKNDLTITALYNEEKDVVDEEVDGYVKVTFETDTTKGNFVDGAKTVFYVNPDKEVSLAAPGIEVVTGYKHTGWDKDLTQAHQYTAETTINATYEELADVIEGGDRPAGYLEVTLDAKEGKFADGNTTKTQFVKPGTETSRFEQPTANDTTQEFTAWENDPTTITEDVTLNAQYDTKSFDEENIDKIEVTKMPNMTEYTEGEEFNPEGIEVTLTDKNGNTKVVKADNIEELNEVLEANKITISPSADQVLTNGDNNKPIKVTKTLRDEDGNLVTISVNSVDTLKVNALDKTSEPSVDPIEDGATRVTGKTEKDADVKITLPDGGVYTGKANADGDFEITVPALKQGQTIDVIAKDGNRPESDPKEVTVGIDTSKLEQTIKEAEEGYDKNNDNALNADDELDLNNPIDKELIDAFENAKDVLADAKTEETTKTQDDVDEAQKRLEDAMKAKEKDVNKMPQPVVDTTKDGDTKVTGETEPEAKVEITLPDNTTVTVTANEEGKFEANVPALRDADTITIVVKDPTGARKDSDPITETVGIDTTGLNESNDKAVNGYDSNDDNALTSEDDRLDPENSNTDKALVDAQKEAKDILEGTKEPKPNQETVDKAKKDLDEALANKEKFEDAKDKVGEVENELGNLSENPSKEDFNNLQDKIDQAQETIDQMPGTTEDNQDKKDLQDRLDQAQKDLDKKKLEEVIQRAEDKLKDETLDPDTKVEIEKAKDQAQKDLDNLNDEDLTTEKVDQDIKALEDAMEGAKAQTSEPEVDPVKNDATKITGKAEPNADVTIVIGEDPEVTRTVKAGTDGSYEYNHDKPLKEGTEITVTATAPGKTKSVKVGTTVGLDTEGLKDAIDKGNQALAGETEDTKTPEDKKLEEAIKAGQDLMNKVNDKDSPNPSQAEVDKAEQDILDAIKAKEERDALDKELDELVKQAEDRLAEDDVTGKDETPKKPKDLIESLEKAKVDGENMNNNSQTKDVKTAVDNIKDILKEMNQPSILIEVIDIGVGKSGFKIRTNPANVRLTVSIAGEVREVETDSYGEYSFGTNEAIEKYDNLVIIAEKEGFLKTEYSTIINR